MVVPAEKCQWGRKLLWQIGGEVNMANENDSSKNVWQEQEPMTEVGETLASKDSEALSEAYRELGKQYYEGRFEDPLPELLPLFEKITRLRRQAADVGNRFCPQCGKPVKAGSKFCGSCGCQLT